MSDRIVAKEIEAQIRAKGKKMVEIHSKEAMPNAVIGTYFGKACNYEMAMSKLRSVFFAAADELGCPVEDVIMENSYNRCTFLKNRLETDEEFEKRVKQETEYEVIWQRRIKQQHQSKIQAAERQIAKYNSEIERLNKIIEKSK